jgi:hypothetical protein
MKALGFWKPVIVSLAVTPVALLLGIASAGAGHGNYFWAKILFPYTMLSTFLFESITAPFILLAIVQFPLYGFLLAFASGRKRLGSLAIGLAVAHILAAALCLFLASDNFS